MEQFSSTMLTAISVFHTVLFAAWINRFEWEYALEEREKIILQEF